jgi:hypothetical protein
LPPKSSISEIRINSNPFAAEFDRPGFGRVEIFIRPGANKIHGSAFYNMGDGIFDSRNPLIIGFQPGYTSKFYTGDLTGPLTRKASFFLDFNRRQINQGALINARTLDNSLNQVTENGVYPTPQRLWMLSPRVDYQINPNNTLVLRYNHTSNSTVTEVGGINGFSLPTQRTNQSQKNNTVQITDTAILGTKAIDETRFQMLFSNVNQVAAGDFTSPGIDVASSFNSGGAPYSSNFNHNRTYELQNLLTLTHGKHAIKAGGRLRQSHLTSQSTTNSMDHGPSDNRSSHPQARGVWRVSPIRRHSISTSRHRFWCQRVCR